MIAGELSDLFKVSTVLGQGQTATVYEASRRSDGVTRALKAFRADELRSKPHSVELLRAEVRRRGEREDSSAPPQAHRTLLSPMPLWRRRR